MSASGLKNQSAIVAQITETSQQPFSQINWNDLPQEMKPNKIHYACNFGSWNGKIITTCQSSVT